MNFKIPWYRSRVVAVAAIAAASLLSSLRAHAQQCPIDENCTSPSPGFCYCDGSTSGILKTSTFLLPPGTPLVIKGWGAGGKNDIPGVSQVGAPGGGGAFGQLNVPASGTTRSFVVRPGEVFYNIAQPNGSEYSMVYEGSLSPANYRLILGGGGGGGSAPSGGSCVSRGGAGGSAGATGQAGDPCGTVVGGLGGSVCPTPPTTGGVLSAPTFAGGGGGGCQRGGSGLNPTGAATGGGGGSSYVSAVYPGTARGGNYDIPGMPGDPDRGNRGEGAGAYSAGTVTDPATPGRIVFRWPTSPIPAKGDLNGDGKADLVLRHDASGATPWKHEVWLMDGRTRVGEPVEISAPAQPWELSGMADFNADGQTDLVFWNPTTGGVEFRLMNGTTQVGLVPLASPPSADWKLSATADFNSDFKPDLLWRNTTTQRIMVWVMNGTSHSASIIPNPDQALNANWEIAAAQDFGNPNTPSVSDHDGFADLLWYNSTSGKIVVWFMDATVNRITGVFTIPDSAGNANWKVLAGGDFGTNGSTPALDTNVDVVWRNATSGKFVVWFMNAAATRLEGTFTDPDSPSPDPTSWTIVGPR